MVGESMMFVKDFIMLRSSRHKGWGRLWWYSREVKASARKRQRE